VPTRPDRNLAIERLLREGHAAPPGADASACIAAEELAAWVDGGLSQADATRVEAHLASCHACQALLGAFARTESGPTVASTRARGPARLWLPFAAAAVLVVGVWLAGIREEQASDPAPAERQMARAEQPPATPSAPAQPPGDNARRRGENRRIDGRQIDQRQSALLEDRSAASRARSVSAGRVEPAEPAVELRREADAASAEQKAVAAAPPAAGAPAPPATPQAGAGAAAELAGTPQLQANPAPQRSRLEGLPANAQLAASRAVDARLAIASPDGVSRWRIVGNALEVSADGGATWLPATGVTPADLADVTSGASPARGVSWLVGRGGLVLVTTDGRRFIRTSPPAAAVLTGVEPQDGAIAEARASDGRAWRTVNTGRTWIPIR
jgi:hypothetical protein